ncbi:hypothetical protein I79_004453 [Cricetulus griseus]|uniref:Uncharacterized protein n=1 Tax=Cricetulus griseus TaxID=10029 RepID=G3H2N5_CRIGR|nr:hypothetical protein I79_004453 [Cricetulus griseus]
MGNPSWMAFPCFSLVSRQSLRSWQVTHFITDLGSQHKRPESGYLNVGSNRKSNCKHGITYSSQNGPLYLQVNGIMHSNFYSTLGRALRAATSFSKGSRHRKRLSIGPCPTRQA